MSEIKPKIIDGEARCNDLCPKYEMSCPHTNQPEHHVCGPYYRAALAESRAKCEEWKTKHREEAESHANTTRVYHKQEIVFKTRAESVEAELAALREVVDNCVTTLEDVDRCDMNDYWRVIESLRSKKWFATWGEVERHRACLNGEGGDNE